MKIEIGNKTHYTYDLSDIRGKSKSIKFQIDTKVDITEKIIINKDDNYYWILMGCELKKPIREIDIYSTTHSNNLRYYEYDISFVKKYGTSDKDILLKYLRNIKLKELGI